MMEWMRGQYRDSSMPIVYVCGDTVYRNTQHCLFSSEGRDPINKGRESWKRKYELVIDEFKNDGKSIREFDTCIGIRLKLMNLIVELKIY